MKTWTAHLLNALLQMSVSARAYFASENKIVAHIAVFLTLIVIIALVMPLRGALAREDTMALLRVGLMLAASIVAFVFFIKSFIEARKAKDI